nr:MAG TPA: hypothetical protein [Caudoviricetes sp.]
MLTRISELVNSFCTDFKTYFKRSKLCTKFIAD